MIRSICILSREYPPDTDHGGIARLNEMAARAMVAEGVAVHVITLDPTGQGRRVLQDGVAVYRLPMPGGALPGCPEVEQGLWATTVANFYAGLDAQVGFDVVVAPDYFAEGLKVRPGPNTPLVVQLHGCRSLVLPESVDPVAEPGGAVAAAMEHTAIGRADAVLTATDLVAHRTLGGPDGRVAVLPPPIDMARFAVHPRHRRGRLELLFLGRLEPRKAPELALATVAELSRRGVDAALTLVGRDTGGRSYGTSYRRGVLLPLMDDLGLGFDRVRFVDHLDLAGVNAHLANADAAILPSRLETLHAAAVEALASGLPVICGPDHPLGRWVEPGQGLFAAATTDPAAFAAAAADRLEDADWREAAGAAGAARVREVFDAGAAARRYLQLFTTLVDRRRPVRPATRTTAVRPKLGVVVLAHNALEYTKRCLASVLHHTTVPLRLVVVDNGSADGTADWLTGLDDRRVRPVLLPDNRGVSGGRNVGLDHLDGDEGWIVFLDNDTEVLAEWWAPFVAALEADPDAGIAGEDGVRVTWGPDGRALHPVLGAGPQPCDVAVGYCMVMRPQTVGRIGRFDEQLGLFWHDDDDYAMRAARIGERVLRCQSGKVLHFEHRSSATITDIWDGPSTPAAMSADNQRYVAEKVARQRPTPTSRFLVLAHADEVLADASVLATYGRAFTAKDEASLVVYGPGLDPAQFERTLRQVAGRAGVDVEHGPQLAAILPPTPSAAADREVAHQVYAVLSVRRPEGPFAHLAVVSPDDPDGLRLLAARAWRARPAPTSATTN